MIVHGHSRVHHETKGFHGRLGFYRGALIINKGQDLTIRVKGIGSVAVYLEHLSFVIVDTEPVLVVQIDC